MSSRRPARILLQLRGDADAARVPRQDRPQVQEEDRGNRQVSLRLMKIPCSFFHRSKYPSQTVSLLHVCAVVTFALNTIANSLAVYFRFKHHSQLACGFYFRFKVVLRLSTTFAPVLQHGRIATIVICLHTLRRASTRKLNRFWQNWHLQRWLIVKSKSKMASRPRQRPSTTEKPTMTFSIKPRLICIITKTTVDGASTNIALTIRVAVKCHRQRLFSRDTKWPKAKY